MTSAPEQIPVISPRCRVGKAKRAHPAPSLPSPASGGGRGGGGHGAQERAFAHPTCDPSRSKSARAWRFALVGLALLAAQQPAVAVQPDEILKDQALEARARALSRE